MSLPHCQMSSSVGVGEHGGLYSTWVSKAAFWKRCPKNPETSSKEI